MKGLPSNVTLPPSRLIKWGRWLQTILLVTLLLLLFHQLNLLPPSDEAAASAKERRGLHELPIIRAESARL
jgi:hypothetical protein